MNRPIRAKMDSAVKETISEIKDCEWRPLVCVMARAALVECNFNRFRIFGRVAHRCTMAKMQRTMHQVRTHLQIETNSNLLHLSSLIGVTKYS